MKRLKDKNMLPEKRGGEDVGVVGVVGCIDLFLRRLGLGQQGR